MSTLRNRKFSSLSLTVHGLRRTFITTARRLKIFEDADRLTNHVDSSFQAVITMEPALTTFGNRFRRLPTRLSD
ncbi:MAG: hypothetical protein M0T70_03050 [Geobacteraceae bacterium]|nr:hypothetical protein [Geobacteraceae bacterium]